MTRKNIIKSLAVVASVGMLTGCSGDYLDLAPETSISESDVAKSVEANALLINGIASAMSCQYYDTQYNELNGESYINSIYNETLGQDDICGLGLSQWGVENVTGGSSWKKDNYVLNALPWDYCYNLIAQANTIIANIDNAEGDENQRKFVKAQALTFRAHGYTKLMQFYCPRWQDSRNGEAKCAVMKTKPGLGDAPLCTANDVFKLIYDDLTEAIKLYTESGLKREKKWQPEVNVAYGIFARAALIKNDWKTAQEMAHNARIGYTIMDNNTYLSGFIQDNDDVIWNSSDDPSTIYYWAWGSKHSVNGKYVSTWKVGAGAINLDLYNMLDPNDIRRQCYLMPDKMDVLVAYNKGYNPGKIQPEDWWNPNLVVESSNVDLSGGPSAKKDAVDGKWGLYNVAMRYCQYYGENVFTGEINAMFDDEGYGPYYKRGNEGTMLISKGVYGTLTKIPFGAQFKFWSIPPYGVTKYCFMRSTEMCLTEAEAAFHNGDEATALKCLKEVNDIRIPGYSFSGNGQALLDEIRLCRRIELWGEGFSWPDFKRWNLPIVRRKWEAGNPESGNWMIEFGRNTETNVNNGWRMLIPRHEYQHNDLINRDELEY